MWPPILPICHKARLQRCRFWQGCRVLLAATLLSACARLPDVPPPVTELHSQASPHSLLARWAEPLLQQHPDQAGLVLLASGTDAFLARLLLAANASDRLDLQYYLYHQDLTGKVFTWALLQAADRGVRVRLLLDDMATRGADNELRLLNRHPNIDIRLFNPFLRDYPRDMQFLTRYGVSTRRMHNKTMIADNTLAISGGRNIGDEYFDAARNAVVFGDLDVLTLGPVVDDASTEFDRYWNSALAVPVEQVLNDGDPHDQQPLHNLRQQLQEWLQGKREHPYVQALQNRNQTLSAHYEQRLFWGKAYVVADAPDKIRSRTYQSPLFGNLITLLDNAQQEVLLVSPYFVPGDEGVAFLAALVARGVKVQVLTNSLASTDVPAVHSAYKHYRAALLRAGVELFELRPDASSGRENRRWTGSSSASLHAKMLVIDQRYFYVGSMNLDPRSIRENTEMGVLFEQAQLGQQASLDLQQNLPFESYQLQLHQGEVRWQEMRTDGAVQYYDNEPHASLWRRLQSWLLGVLPLEAEL